jgi:chaperone modulatory protein CbpM
LKQLIRVTIEEASRICGPSREDIAHFIQEEWIKPFEDEAFDDEDISRIRLIHELMEELGVNEESVPIILHLIDQLNVLQLRLKDFNSEAS